MSEVNYVEKSLGERFNSERGNSKYTKKYCNSHKGKYEVFTGTTIGSFGFINTYDYDENLLSYTTDGENAGTLEILKGKYNVGGHRAILIPKYDNIDLEYFERVLQKVFFDNVKRGDVPSITWGRIKDCVISIPVNAAVEFDLEKQKEIVKKYKLIENRKQEIKAKLDYINRVEVDFISNEISLSRKMKIKDIFDLSIGTNSSKFTKTFIKNNSGDIPVYGASKDNVPSYGYVKDNAIIVEESYGKRREIKVGYFEDCLTYNIDGLAGYIFYRKGRFSLSEKVRPLIIKEELKEQLNPMFLKYLIEPIFRSNIKGRLAENGKNEYSKLYQNMIEDLEVEIPITKDGEIDLEMQNQVVEKYKLIDKMKKNITEKGLSLVLANVELNELNRDVQKI